MKHSQAFFVVLLLGAVAAVSSFRFATYNIQSGSNVEHVYNLTATAEAIKQLNVDFLALQEVDNVTTRHPVDQTTYIARYNEDQPFRSYHFEKMRDFQNGGYGVAILARDATVSRVLTYHYNNTMPEQCVVPKDGDYCQGLALFEVPMQLGDSTPYSLYFGTTHLGIGLGGLQQLTEAKQIVQWTTEQIIETSTKPFIVLITGDFNTIPTDPAIQDVMRSVFDDLWTADDVCQKIVDPSNVDGYTFDALNPTKRIDYFFMLKSSNFPEQIKLSCEIQVVSSLASDHRPVVMQFDLSEQ